MSEVLREVVITEVAQEPEWGVKSDSDAEWAIDTTNDKLQEIARYKQALLDKINTLQDRLAGAEDEERQAIEWRNAHLARYFETIDPQLRRKTKTQEQYRLPSGKIIKKYQAPAFERKNDELVAWLKTSGLTDLVKVEEKADWARLKDAVAVAGQQVVYLATGEVVEGVTAVDRPPVIEFKEG